MKENGFLKLLKKYKKAIKYTISSLSSSAIELILFFLMTSVFFKGKEHIILIATIVSRIISSIINFLINKYWCFVVYNRTFIQAVEYTVLFLVKLYLSYFFVNMIVSKYSINPTLIKMPIDIGLFFVGYVVQNFIIFRRNKKEDLEINE